MNLIIGLGNPGEKYKNNRHNVGFLVVDRLLTTDHRENQWEEKRNLKSVICRLKTVDVLLAKPQTFMNKSGKAVLALTNYYHLVPSALFVIHDDLDIALGSYKIQKGVGPKIHGGINSINQVLGTSDYWRVRVGVENRLSTEKRKRARGEEYVLQDFTKEEFEVVNKVIEEIMKEMVNKRII